MLGLSGLIGKRRPPAGLDVSQLTGWSFEGHTHYLIIDDVDQIPDSPAMTGPYVGQRPWTPLIELLAQAGFIFEVVPADVQAGYLRVVADLAAGKITLPKSKAHPCCE